MYIAMNRFNVTPGREAEFEEVWKGRAGLVDGCLGFVDFKILRPNKGCEEYVSLTTWESEQAFIDWTQSEAFAKGHRGSPSGLIQGHPKLECFVAFDAS